jgi:hypothetical protein
VCAALDDLIIALHVTVAELLAPRLEPGCPQVVGRRTGLLDRGQVLFGYCSAALLAVSIQYAVAVACRRGVTSGGCWMPTPRSSATPATQTFKRNDLARWAVWGWGCRSLSLLLQPQAVCAGCTLWHVGRLVSG